MLSRVQGDVISRWPGPLQPIGRMFGRLPFSRLIWRYIDIREPISARLWKIDEMVRRLKLSLIPDSKMAHFKEILEYANGDVGDQCLISITVPSRKLGNRNNSLETVLDSFVRMTKKPSQCEFLLKVDDDDDLPYFHRIKRKYQEVNLRFFVTPQGRGFADSNHYHSFLLDQASASSKAWFQSGDEGLFVRDGWDLDIYELIERESLFVIGGVTFESQISMVGPIITDPKPIYCYGCDGVPIVSFSIVKALREASGAADGWGTLGGDFPYTDAFIASIMKVLHDKHGIKIYHQIDEYATQVPRKVSWTKNPKRVAMFVSVLDNFFSPSSEEERTKVVDRMYQSGVFQVLEESKVDSA